MYRALSIIPCLLLLGLISATWCLPDYKDDSARLSDDLAHNHDLAQLSDNKDDLAQLSDNKDDLAQLSDNKDDLAEPSNYKDDSARLSDYEDHEKLPSAMLRYQRFFHNNFDQWLHRDCGRGSAVFRVISYHSNHHEDRRWRWGCKRVLPSHSHEHCRWYENVNNYDQPMFFMCGQNMYLRGVKSYHHNHYEDRRWSFYCCGSPGFKTRSCYNTGYKNSWDGDMNFKVHHGRVISGVYSYHDNHKE